MEEPFFSQKLLRVSPDGTYRSFSGTERVAAFQDHLEIGKIKVFYHQIVRIEASENFLHLAYAAEDGHNVERYFPLAMLRVTTPKKLSKGSSRFVPSLPYTLLSLVTGWWAFPAGPSFVLKALATNSRGGVDISESVAFVLSGQPSPAWATAGPF
jgi:hypothetical protein